MTRLHFTRSLIALVALIFAFVQCSAAGTAAKVPVIYCSDLFHPHADLDDHFDLACMYAIKEFDIKLIVLDDMAAGFEQIKRPGRIPVSQLNAITGRKVPWTIGSPYPLKKPEDKGLDGPTPDHKGIERIIQTLKASKEPVTIIAVGSMRNPMAAYNREPELFKKKVKAIYAFIGEGRGSFREWNVGLDPNAYVRMMNSDLPVYWVPCFSGGEWVNDGNGSFWRAKHSELLAEAAEPVVSYFRYAILEPDGSRNPIESLTDPIPPTERKAILSDTRNLWGTSIFGYIAGRKYVRRGNQCLVLPANLVEKGDEIIEVFGFEPVSVYVDPATGKEMFEDSPRAHRVLRFKAKDMTTYAPDLTSCVKHLYGELSRAIVLK